VVGGLVGFEPVPVFDVFQTDGEPLSDLETAASGDAGNLVSRPVDDCSRWHSRLRSTPLSVDTVVWFTFVR